MSVKLTVNGKAVEVADGTPVATAVVRSGASWFRHSVAGQPRAPICGMGICFECRVTINGQPHQRSCLLPCEEGMEVRTDAEHVQAKHRHETQRPFESQRRYEVRRRYEAPSSYQAQSVVVGAGPAGLAAAFAMAERGRSVLLIDESAETGGQIWRRHASNTARSLRKIGQLDKVTHWPMAQVVGRPERNTLLVEQPDKSYAVQFETLILATGARELFLPFPGWTLPGVAGAGGLELLARGGLPVAGTRIVVAGTGPLLLAAAAELREHGAQILAVVEQAPAARLWRLGLTAAATQPGKLLQGARLRWQLRGVPQWRGWWPREAIGKDKLEAVILSNGETSRTVACDYLACGFHLLSNTELPALMGCQLEDGRTVVDEWQQTSEEGIYAAGETTGVAGVELAVLEGRIAGMAACGDKRGARRLQVTARRARRFARALERTFTLRSELRHLPNSETIICRCEDVTWEQLKGHSSWRQAKLQTRCGMGPCQGRICGPACDVLLGWGRHAVRPPLLPVRLSTLAGSKSEPNE